MNKLIMLCLFILLLPSMLLAQGSIKGTVTDLQTGEALIGANVLVEGTTFGAATDANGVYKISNLDAGTYTVRASFIGYQTITTTQVRVNNSLTTEVNFKLPAEGVQVQEIQVVAQRPLVNKSNTNAIRITTNEEIDALPIRGIANIAALTPGVIQQSGQVYIRGSRQDETGYYLEGTNITNPVVNFFGGARARATQVTIPQDAVEEIQVQAGGYTAEYGGSNAGIIRAQLKSGTSKLKASLQYITDNWTFKSRANRYDGVQHLGTYSYGFNDITGTISTPLVGDNIKFFGVFENTSRSDRAPSFYPGFNLGTINDNITPGDSVVLSYPGGPIPGNSSNLYAGAATLTFDYNPTIVRAIGTYSFNRDRLNLGPGFIYNNNPTYTIFDMNRLPKRDVYNGDFGLKVTHILSSSAFFEVNASYVFDKGKTYDPQMGDDFTHYGDKAANAAAGVPWTYGKTQTAKGPYDVPNPYQIFSSFQFAVPNQPLLVGTGSIYYYNKYEHTNINLNGAFSDQLSEENSIKIGGEIQIMAISNYSVPTQNLAQLQQTNPDLTMSDILILNGVDNYGYDALGNKYSGSSSDYNTGSIAPHRPIFAGAYIEDKLEYKNLIVNAGLRYDYINTDNYTFKDPIHPNQAFNTSTHNVKDAGQLVKTPSFQSISPRLGFSFPITDVTIFHAQYGKFVQQPSLADLYVSPYRIAYFINPNAGFFNPAPWGLNLRPTRTTQYEIGFTQQIASFASIDITAYYKDISNQVVFATQNTDQSTGWNPYQILVNGDYATTSGFEIDFRMRRTARFLVNGSLSLQNAKGTGDNPYSNNGEFGSPISNIVFVPNYIVPLSFNHTLSGNLNIDYRFGENDGPDILHQFGASLLLTFASGHPYTLGAGTVQDLGTSNPYNAAVTGTRFRTALAPLNSSVTPSTFRVDMRIDKTVELPSNLSANIFIQVINLFNTKNVADVYNRTGSAATDGFLTNPDLAGYKAIQKYGNDYSKVYTSTNLDYAGLYGTPRQIRLGLRLEY